MQNKRFKYTILRNADGKYWLWYDERGEIIDGKYVPNMQPYHELVTGEPLRIGAEIWSEDLESVPAACQLRPIGEYSNNYTVKARIINPAAYLETSASSNSAPVGKKPGMGRY